MRRQESRAGSHGEGALCPLQLELSGLLSAEELRQKGHPVPDPHKVSVFASPSPHLPTQSLVTPQPQRPPCSWGCLDLFPGLGADPWAALALRLFVKQFSLKGLTWGGEAGVSPLLCCALSLPLGTVQFSPRRP